jgi:pimeloyl-ACP methyl ester carboxylesterase
MDAQRTQPAAGAVVLVHGLAANSVIMAPLARTLSRHFVRVTNWGYRSLWYRIERHGQALAGVLRKLDETFDGPIHLVTHSMGGIIGRIALSEFAPRRFGRFLMIAPPNRGSHIASRLAPYLGYICPPLVQLRDCEDSFVCSLPHPPVGELGVIAASTDYLVQAPSTRLGCEADHITLPGLHSSLLLTRATAEQVRHFLHYGRFHRASEATATGSSESPVLSTEC